MFIAHRTGIIRHETTNVDVIGVNAGLQTTNVDFIGVNAGLHVMKLLM